MNAAPKANGILPDVVICRAKSSGFPNYFDCLVEVPNTCRYALSFGGTYFCLSPERAEIAARTKTALNSEIINRGLIVRRQLHRKI